MPTPFDASVKHLVDTHLPDWAEFVGSVLGLPGPVKLSPLDGDLSSVSLAADKLFRLSGSVEAVVHLEFQSRRDDDLPRRSLRYSVLANVRYDLPVYTVLILFTAKSAFAGIDGPFIMSHADGSEYLRFSYSVVRVWEIPAERFLSGGAGLMPLAMLTDEAQADPKAAFAQIAQRLKPRFPNPRDQKEFVTRTLVLAGLRYEQETIQMLMGMVNAMKESVTWKLIHEDGVKEGKEEGWEEGSVETARSILLELTEFRFGTPAESIHESILKIGDLERLRRMTRRIATASSWEDLLATE